ncbi:MAG: sodium:alanine symporter family protein [Candidatus Hydrogenedentes bacterium]|nr:sodium:alanine symporter family protein [Candidatus Hydrogenedentota bacterium]
MQSFSDFVASASGVVWGPVLLILLVGTGIYLSIRLRGIQFRAFVPSIVLAFVERKEKGDSAGDITHFQALMTALAATVGTGNIAGVATAITLGGPGALFWMWMTGLVGMATKYAEAVLAVKYRDVDANGNYCGGPMYYITKGLGWKWMGIAFALFASIAAFGIGNMVQSNSVADAIHDSFGVARWVTGLVLAVATAAVILGGIKGIARVTQVLVPIMIVVYSLGALVAIVMNISALPETFMLVIRHAFSPVAAAGGFAGATIMQAMRWGVARGVFSNESGLGSAPIAAAAAQTSNPVRQALVSMTQTFIDTIVICSMTGFVILDSGLWTSGLNGAPLTSAAFSSALPGQWGGIIVTLSLMLFAYSTLLGWSYYGEKSIEFILGTGSIIPYRVLFCVFVAVGAGIKLELVWNISDVFNGLMAFPNLIALVLLSHVVVKETRDHFDSLR